MNRRLCRGGNFYMYGPAGGVFIQFSSIQQPSLPLLHLFAQYCFIYVRIPRYFGVVPTVIAFGWPLIHVVPSRITPPCLNCALPPPPPPSLLCTHSCGALVCSPRCMGTRQSFVPLLNGNSMIFRSTAMHVPLGHLALLDKWKGDGFSLHCSARTPLDSCSGLIGEWECSSASRSTVLYLLRTSVAPCSAQRCEVPCFIRHREAPCFTRLCGAFCSARSNGAPCSPRRCVSISVASHSYTVEVALLRFFLSEAPGFCRVLTTLTDLLLSSKTHFPHSK